MISTRVAHAVSNYISTISDLAYIISLDAEDPEAVRAHAGEIQERVQSLSKFLESVRKELTEQGI